MYIEQAAAHADWYVPNWRRWLRRPATPSFYTRDDDPAQAHRVWSEAVLAGPPGPIEIHYPIVPIEENQADWNWDHMLVSIEGNILRSEFELDSPKLATIPVKFVVQMLGPTRTFNKRDCTVVRAHVELLNHWFTTHLDPNVPLNLPRQGWITICVKPDDPKNTKLAHQFYRRATPSDRVLCRDRDVRFEDWQHFAPPLYKGVPDIEREDPNIPAAHFPKVFEYLTGVVANLLPNQANERIRARLDMHPRVLAGSHGVHLPSTTIAPHPNVMKLSGDVRTMAAHVLGPIRGCVGSIHEVTLICPRATLPSFGPGDPEWTWNSIVCALEDEIPIRATASPYSQVIGLLHTKCLCRMIGRPRMVNQISCARVEILTPHIWDRKESCVSSLCGGHVSLSAAQAGGTDYFRPASADDEPLLYEDIPLAPEQLDCDTTAAGGGHWRWLSPTDEQNFAFLKALVAKALPDPELQRRVDQLHEPPQKAASEGRKRSIPTASSIECSPMSFLPPLPWDHAPMRFTKAVTKRGGATSSSASVATHCERSPTLCASQEDLQKVAIDPPFLVTCH
eukprot:5655543-Amphidinium_carterae.1